MEVQEVQWEDVPWGDPTEQADHQLTHPLCRTKRQWPQASIWHTILSEIVVNFLSFGTTYPEFSCEVDRRVSSRHFILLDLKV